MLFGLIKRKTRWDLAREAFKKKDTFLSRIAHNPQKILTEPWHKAIEAHYLGQIVFGASDGIITAFAAIAGITGAGFPPEIVLIIGLTYLIAEGFALAAGEYLSYRSINEYVDHEIKREQWEVDNFPEAEKSEIREIYRLKGLSGKQLEDMTNLITSNKKLWIDIMVQEELGLSKKQVEAPIKNSAIVFFSFFISGFMPLMAYAFTILTSWNSSYLFLAACIITSATMFIVGALREIVTGLNWFRSGLEMLISGGTAAAVAYFIGFLLHGLFKV